MLSVIAVPLPDFDWLCSFDRRVPRLKEARWHAFFFLGKRKKKKSETVLGSGTHRTNFDWLEPGMRSKLGVDLERLDWIGDCLR